MDLNSKIVIIGAGIFGLSTAHKLASEGYKNILVLDRHVPPTPDASSNDINRIIRFDYGDADYLAVAREAFELWSRSPRYEGIFVPTPIIVTCTKGTSGSVYFNRTTSQLTRAGIPWTPLESAAAAHAVLPQLTGPLAAAPFEGYYNPNCGWADAAKTVAQLRDDCLDMGVSFVGGAAGTVTGFETTGGGSKGGGKIKAARTVAGDVVRGDFFILTAGAWSSSLVSMYNSVLATGQVLAYIRLTEDEVRKYENLPIYLNLSTGWFNFPPHKDTRLLKAAIHGRGYTRRPGASDVAARADTTTTTTTTTTGTIMRSIYSTPPAKPPHGRRIDYAPPDGEARLRAGLREILPELADRPFERTGVCWYTDTPSGDFLMDYHPDHPNLFVGGSGSGHAFKFTPVLGKYMSLGIKKQLPPNLAQKWRFHTEYADKGMSVFLGDGSRDGPERRELRQDERAGLDNAPRGKL
ncbi:hypothetical protein JDV02_005005 [Purpureocillium takamizusanense]|uniref:FAD dependent oxidoreductase domain-containing protein n=1 Tax=Purpureocillium takamizusanense TaxID=2060973 RepID=A0A9Q8QH20_9HYPO|nr:uncharacterized protein JDV02_005005 [Purpureocillium takamizusanense]UNI18749.1 hypothetical protein JDV02_005005 [Purpureocillium takamizusanense]